jgi:hypothetical protein
MGLIHNTKIVNKIRLKIYIANNGWHFVSLVPDVSGLRTYEKKKKKNIINLDKTIDNTTILRIKFKIQ